MKKFGKYLHVFKNSWQYQLEYRIDVFIRVGIVLISMISVFYLWNDVYSQKASMLGYSKEQIMTYYLIVGYIFTSIYSALPISQEIEQGELSAYITKPINYIFYHYWQTLAKRLFRLVLGLPVLLLIFFIFRNNLYIVQDVKSYLILLLTCLGAINILFLFDLLVNFLEFWLFQSWSVGLISDSIVSFFSGALIPLFLLPSYIQSISDFLPFKYTNFFIVDSFLGRNNAEQIIVGIGIQISWMIMLSFIASLVWKRGLARYEATGN